MAEAHLALGSILLDLGRSTEAEASLRSGGSSGGSAAAAAAQQAAGVMAGDLGVAPGGGSCGAGR